MTEVSLRFVLDGRALDAAATVLPSPRGLEVVLESRSGAKGGIRARNPDYFDALYVILWATRALVASIVLIELVSRPALKLSEEKRVLPLAFPLRLRRGDDLLAIRRNVTQAQRSTARGPSVKDSSGGNHTKRIRIVVATDAPDGLDVFSALCESCESTR